MFRLIAPMAMVALLLVSACGEPVDPDPRPELMDVIGAEAVLEDTNPDPNVVEVAIAAQNRTIDLGGGLSYEMMTYNGTVPGPLLQAVAGDEVIVHFTNELDEPTTIHWHGLRISDQMDGNPRIQNPVQPGETFTYRFVIPEAGTFWYHPHVRSNQQVEKGLYGPIVVRDELDPEYDAERMIVLDDILTEPGAAVLPPFLASHPEVMHGRYGNVLLTNGHVSELVASASAEEGQVERWRIVNVANARTMTLALSNARFRVIGTDGGLIPEPYETTTLTLPVGQRFDLEVVYDTPGRAALQSRMLASDGAGGVTEVSTPVYVIDVAATGQEPREIERTLPAPRPAGEISRRETITFDAVEDLTTGIRWRLNGDADMEGPLFTFQQGEVVHITLDNLAGPEHPFHLHGQWFEVVRSDGAMEPGLYDTVLVPGVSQVEIIAYFDNPGQWMTHCHILEHAELGMMGEIVVEPN